MLAVTGFTKFYNQSPDKMTKEKIENYLLHLKQDKGNAPNSCYSVLTGLRFFYKYVTEKEIPVTCSIRRTTRKLLQVLTMQEIWKIICSTKKKKDLPLSYEAIRMIYEKARKKAGVKRGTGIHTLRHSFATHLLEAGSDIRKTGALNFTGGAYSNLNRFDWNWPGDKVEDNCNNNDKKSQQNFFSHDHPP